MKRLAHREFDLHLRYLRPAKAAGNPRSEPLSPRGLVNHVPGQKRKGCPGTLRVRSAAASLQPRFISSLNTSTVDIFDRVIFISSIPRQKQNRRYLEGK
jgi:hypothetical protein